MTVSIVVPTYRRPNYLAKCIKALLLQKFDKQRYEIIVVSDGPDEETGKLLAGWSGYAYPRMRYLNLPQKKGPAAARNYGWLNAKGAIIAFTDDDCIPDQNWLREIAANCHADECLAITGKVIVPIGKHPTDYERNTANLQTADFITANCALTKNALIKAGGFDEQFSMAWREDSDLEFKLINDNVPIKKIESAVVVHPVRRAAWGVSIKEQKKTMYNALLYKKYPRLYRKKISRPTPVLYYCIIAAFAMLMAGLLTTHPGIKLAGFASWLGLTGYFIAKRLYGASLSGSHVAEMVITSFIIPFVSVFWQWYGAVKYRVLFI